MASGYDEKHRQVNTRAILFFFFSPVARPSFPHLFFDSPGLWIGKGKQGWRLEEALWRRHLEEKKKLHLRSFLARASGLTFSPQFLPYLNCCCFSSSSFKGVYFKKGDQPRFLPAKKVDFTEKKSTILCFKVVATCRPSPTLLAQSPSSHLIDTINCRDADKMISASKWIK